MGDGVKDEDYPSAAVHDGAEVRVSLVRLSGLTGFPQGGPVSEGNVRSAYPRADGGTRDGMEVGALVTDNLFDDPDEPLIKNGRYNLPNLDGSPRPGGGYMRCTNLAGALADQRELNLWEQRQTLRGLRLRYDLYETLCSLPVESWTEKKEERDALHPLIEQCKEAAKGNAGAIRGTARHTMVHAWHHHGVRVGTPKMLKQLDWYDQALEDAGLEPVPGLQERTVVLPDLDVAGTFDSVFMDRRTGEYLMGDLKSQDAFYTSMLVEAQLAILANGVGMWDRERRVYEPMPEVSKTRAVVVWMPKDGEGVTVSPDIDIVHGLATARLAYQIVGIRSRCKSIPHLRKLGLTTS